MKKTTTFMMLGLLLSTNIVPLIATAQTIEENATQPSDVENVTTVESSTVFPNQVDSSEMIEKEESNETHSEATATVASSDEIEVINKEEVNKEEVNKKEDRATPPEQELKEERSLPTEEEQESIDSWMPDKNLQKAISEVIKVPVESMTKKDMLKVKTLYLSSKNIYSLKGLEYATNLGGDVGFNYNHISDISPLFNLKITYLRLAGNNISDVQQFLNMPYLTSLIIPENHVKDLSPIQGSNYTTIAALDQTIYLDEKTVFPDEEVGTTAGIVRPNGDQITSFTGMTTYDAQSDYLSWQLTGGKPKTVNAKWDDSVWVRAHYNAKGTGYAGFSGKYIQPLQYKDDQTAINVHDSIVYIGDSWDPKENFDSAFDREGNQVDYSEILVDDSNVNLSKPGIYKVTYTYKGKSVTAVLTVKDKSKVSVHYMNEQGAEIHKSQTLLGKPKETYDTSQAPYFIQQIDDYYVDTQNLPTNRSGEFTDVAQTVIYKYKKDVSLLSVHNTTLTVGDTWKEEDNFDKAVDIWGNPVSFNQLTHSGTVDTTTAGVYKVVYEQSVPEIIESKVEGKHFATAMITVLPKDETHVKVHDSQLTVGDSWKAEDNFDYAKDFYGNDIPLSAIQVTGNVDTMTPGEYQVTYSQYVLNIFMRGLTEGKYEATATITVKEKEVVPAAPVTVKYQDEKGNTLHEEKTISGLVGEAYDATTSEYQLSIEGYILTGVSDNVKGTLSEKNQEVIYTYIKDLSQVSVHDSEITVGDAWKAEDNFDRAIDESGEEVSFEQIIVTGQVDTNTAGSYKVHYQLPKTIESRQSATEAIATITVLPKDETHVKVHDSQLTVGDSWKAEDNFDYAKDFYGNDIPLSAIQVTGNVDTMTPGEYQVTYSQYVLNIFTRGLTEGKYEATATITVKEKEVVPAASVTVKYQDEKGNTLHEEKTISGLVGETYVAEELELEGYRFVRVIGNEKGMFTNQEQLVIYVYEKVRDDETTVDTGESKTPDETTGSQSDKGNVIIHYTDEEGNSLVKDKVITGTVGSSYETKPISFLPKTGESQVLSSIFTKIGIGILVIIMGIWGFFKRESIKEKNDR
ncbi:bacterial Ig-like domain-containing protein [Enterococcus phoeniculicola]|uniref:LPXTG-domain-containing protein cell wall anchor domain n=5 Tax=Enterococcus phoeniculicola TaxID=154621 RepID=R3WI75_9ENTE|nr:bacterial Ig-like domain-containing protein [Enterococcus phoeniculicola]EOL47147.1 hypothetical protein UC3_00678 [Enterococcus phoeniculicola ATCC BAA-412]EOT72969.1 hypothetical protein I589_03240 [Enterococcus phoeniculicola ATCC BAA-412]